MDLRHGISDIVPDFSSGVSPGVLLKSRPRHAELPVKASIAKV